MKIPFHEATHFTIKLSFYPIKLDGLMFFVDGLKPGSFLYMIIDTSVMKICLQCEQKPVCQDIATLQVNISFIQSINLEGSYN